MKALVIGGARSGYGAELLTSKLDREVFRQYLHNLGFYKKVNSDRIPDAEGQEQWNYVHEAITNGFGQGSTVTMLQILQAYTTIFTDGTMVKPYFVDSIIDEKGTVIHQGKTEVLGKVFKPETVKTMRDLMYDNVETKSATRFRLDEVNIMAKTGTSQIVIDGRYDPVQHINSVAIGFPYENPKYILYVAYQSKLNHNTTISAEEIKNVIRKVVATYPDTNDQESLLPQAQSITLKNFINSSVHETKEALVHQGFKPIVLGDGNTVINQYPSQKTVVMPGERVMLLTSKSNIKIPDMSGWSSKEVHMFASFANINIKITGSGFVSKQSVSEGTLIDSETTVDVILE